MWTDSVCSRLPPPSLHSPHHLSLAGGEGDFSNKVRILFVLGSQSLRNTSSVVRVFSRVQAIRSLLKKSRPDRYRMIWASRWTNAQTFLWFSPSFLGIDCWLGEATLNPKFSVVLGRHSHTCIWGNFLFDCFDLNDFFEEIFSLFFRSIFILFVLKGLGLRAGRGIRFVKEEKASPKIYLRKSARIEKGILLPLKKFTWNWVSSKEIGILCFRSVRRDIAKRICFGEFSFIGVLLSVK